MKINNYNVCKTTLNFLYNYRRFIATLIFVFIFVKYISNPGTLIHNNQITRNEVLCFIILGIGITYIDKYIGTLVFIIFMSQYRFAIKEYFNNTDNNYMNDKLNLVNTNNSSHIHEKFQNSNNLNTIIENYIKSQVRLMIKNDQLPSNVVNKTEVEMTDELINQIYEKYFDSNAINNKFKIMNEKYVLGIGKENSAIYNYDLDTYNKLKQSSLIETIS